jgi:hypothetical protein
VVAPLPDLGHLGTVKSQTLHQPSGASQEPLEPREVRKARERADRAARRADRATARVHKALERAEGRQSGGQWSAARQLVDAAGDAATAALTAVSAAADEAQARLAAKARMRELENAVVTARAGGPVDISPPTREEALQLANRVDPGSSGASFVRGVGFILAGVVALAMMMIGGFGWLGLVAPLAILVASSSCADRARVADRSRKAGRIQLELARASLASTERDRAGPATAVGTPTATTAPITRPLKLIEDGNPRTRVEVLAVLDRLVANVRGSVPPADVATVRRIRDRAALALPMTDAPLDLTDHETWLLRQICIDYLPGALEQFLALPSDLASEPVLEGRTARQVLDGQLALMESRLEAMATRSYRNQADGLLKHARFVADSLRPDPFEAWLAEVAVNDAEPIQVATQEPTPAPEASMATSEAATRTREPA